MSLLNSKGINASSGKLWMEIGVFGGVGLVFSNLPIFAMAGLGMAMAVSSLLKRNDYDSTKPDACVQGHFDISATEADMHDNVAESRINQLPDDILFDVVSRLRAFEAAQTRILSRRWRHIWTTSPKIGFSCLHALSYRYDFESHRDCNAKLRFLKAVDECLKLYSGRKLKTFWLSCCFLKDYTPHLEQWMQYLSSLDVEELFLADRHGFGPRFAFSFRLIYGLSTLRTLMLCKCDVQPYLSGQFKSLERLKMDLVFLVGDDMSGLLLSCPNLKFLDMHECTLPSRLKIFGLNLKLKFLTIFKCKGFCGLDISAVDLVKLEIYSDTRVELLLSSVPKLENLIVEFHGKDALSYCFGDAQRDLPQLKYLLVQTTTNQMQCIPPTFKMFDKIQKLYLLMPREFKVDLWSFTTILSVCPLLEAFYLSAKSSRSNKEIRVQRPALRHKHLEHMELAGFSQTQNKIEFAKFILRSTEVLQWLVLRTAFRNYCGVFSFDGGKGCRCCHFSN